MRKIKSATTSKKYLNFDALKSSLSLCFTSIADARVQGRCQHSIRDAMMSAFACMFFQDPSIAEFQRQVQSDKNNNNLHTLFHVDTIPKETQ
jgi:hypothetical protein